MTDIFGQKITQVVHIPAKYDDIDKSIKIEDEYDCVQWVINPDYDETKEYISREDRKEWSPVGMMGKLVVVDDGTCQVNGFCKAGIDGIATKSNDMKDYRVLSRIDDTHIRVLLK